MRYVFQEPWPSKDRGNRLYVSPMDWNSVEYAALVLQAVGGEYSHYGLAYGLASLLLGYDGAFVQTEDSSAYDLNLLCFDESFVSAADVCAAKQIAGAFAADYAASHGLDACVMLLRESAAESGMARLMEALRHFYMKHGLDVQPAQLRIGQGGTAYQYRVRLSGGDVWVGQEWQDSMWQKNPLVTENFLHNSYGQVREFFCVNEVQMAAYRQLFGADKEPVTIILPNPMPGLGNSCYQAGQHQILLLSVDSLTHEYIHALALPEGKADLWETEGLARYFSYYFDWYGIAMLNEDYNGATETMQTRHVYEYRANIGRPIDMAVDFGEIESIIAYTRGYESPNVNYASGAAFVHYLVERYGEATVVRYVLEDVPFDVPLSELVTDWKQWLAENYAGYTLYEKPQTAAPKLPPGKSGK